MIGKLRIEPQNTQITQTSNGNGDINGDNNCKMRGNCNNNCN